MKKILGIVITLLLFVTVLACQDGMTTETNTNLTTQDTTTETPTTSEPYDNRGLVAEECQTIDNIDEWQPVWCDEFDVDGLPSSDHWSYDVGGDGWGNNELQYYTDSDLDNAFVEDGVLNIQAIRESFGGNQYTSARLITKFRGDWEYGRIQVRAKLPEGRGLWSAIWMLPTNWSYGGWPYSGEIDIMEYVGYQPDVIHGTIHTGAYNHGLDTQKGESEYVPTVEEEFHVYEMVWEPASIKLFIDGVQFAVFGYDPDENIEIKNSDAWPFDDPFHLILNLAVGGDWGGARGIDTSIFPQTFQVDYVRVFQKDYAGMDQEPPTKPTRLVLQDTSYNSLRIKWDHSEDDILVSHYNIFVDDQLTDSTTLNAIRLYDLEPNTTYVVNIQTEDFDGNRSDFAQMTVTTEDVPLAVGITQAEDYAEASGVSTEQSEDIDGTLNVGYIDDDDYMVYLLKVEEAGEYRMKLRVASETDGGSVKLFILNNRFALFTLSFDATGGWQEWTTVTSDVFTLQKGVFTFRIFVESGGFNFNYFEIERVD